MKASKERLYKDVEFLTTIQPPRNYRNNDSLEKVCFYLKKEFMLMGASPEEQTWHAEGREYKNIIAAYNTNASKRLVVGAHYDVAGNQPGADDNASAVAGLLETARMVFANKPTLNYRIDFVAYSLEEPPFFATDFMGSYIHAKSLHDKKVDVIGMICYEMIGYFSDKPNSQSFPSPELAKLYPHVANFIIVVGIDKYAAFNTRVHQLMKKDAAIDVQAISFPQSHASAGLAGLSDQRSYWRFNYPALMINDTAFVRNPNYHQVTDTIDTLDFDKMTAVIDGAYNAVVHMG
jgi:Zn-dependent M28 family amino/carboxypeptidase